MEQIAQRIGRALERRGLIERDCENAYLTLDPSSDGPLDDLIGHSITYRIAAGPRAGQKVFTLQTVAAQSEIEEPRRRLAQASGFSLHAGIGIDVGQRKKLERRGWPGVSRAGDEPCDQPSARYRYGRLTSMR